MVLLTFDDVSKRFDGADELAVDGISIEIHAGESVAVIGPSGAGKTTILRLASGAIQPDSGRILLEGEPRRQRSRTATALVYQEGALLERRSALSNALVGQLGSRSRIRGLLESVVPTQTDRATQLLERAGLGEEIHTRVDRLSSGERQRVACIRALLQDACVLLADEPTANLDPATSQIVLELLHESVVDRGLVVVLHDIDLALESFDRIVGIANGCVQFDRPTERVSDALLEELFEDGPPTESIDEDRAVQQQRIDRGWQ